MKMVNLEEQEENRYKSDMSYGNVRNRLNWLDSVMVMKQNCNLGFIDLEEPKSIDELRTFVFNNRLKFMVIEKNEMSEDKADELTYKVILSTLLDKFGLENIVAIHRSIDVIKLITKYEIKVQEIEDRVLEYSLYFNLDGTLCRFHYDTQEYVKKQIEDMRKNLGEQLKNLSDVNLNNMKIALENL